METALWTVSILLGITVMALIGCFMEEDERNKKAKNQERPWSYGRPDRKPTPFRPRKETS